MNEWRARLETQPVRFIMHELPLLLQVEGQPMVGGRRDQQRRRDRGAEQGREVDLLLEGRTAMHAPEIDGKVFVNDYPEGNEPKDGEFYRCRITAAHDYDLVAEIV